MFPELIVVGVLLGAFCCSFATIALGPSTHVSSVALTTSLPLRTAATRGHAVALVRGVTLFIKPHDRKVL